MGSGGASVLWVHSRELYIVLVLRCSRVHAIDLDQDARQADCAALETFGNIAEIVKVKTEIVKRRNLALMTLSSLGNTADEVQTGNW